MPHYLGLLCLLTFSCVYGQNRPQEYAVSRYTMEQGLPSDMVYEITQDNDGYLWVATGNGLCRYDGFAFEEYENGHILAEDMPWLFNYYGEIYVLTWSGKPGLVKKDGLQSYSGSELPSGMRYFLRDRQGGCWIETFMNGFTHVYGRKMKNLKSPNLRLYEHPDGTLYGYGNGLSYYDTAQRVFVTLKEPSSVVYEYIILGGMLLHENLQGRCTLYKDMRAREEWFRFDLNRDEKGKPLPVRHMLKKNANEIWIQDYKNISVYDSLGRLQDNIIPKTGEKNLRVNTFFVDREENIWIATQGQGLFLLEKKSVKNDFPVQDTYITRLKGNRKGDIFMTHSEGRASLLDHRGKYHRYVLPGSVENIFYEIYLWRDNFLGLFGQSLFYIDDSYRLHSFPLPFKIKYIGEESIGHYAVGGIPKRAVETYAYERHPNGDLWVGTNRGLYAFAAGKVPRSPYRAINEFKYHALFYGPDGWTADSLFGVRKIYKLDFKENGIPKDPYICQLLTDHKGTMWIGTQGDGLYAERNGAVYHFTKDNGLLANTVNYLYVDAGNGLWVCTDKGVTYVTPEGGIRYFTAEDGIRSNRVNGVYVSERGEAFLGTAQGLSMLEPEKKASFGPHPPVLTGMQVNGSPYSFTGDDPEWSYLENNLRVEYLSVSFAHRVRYAYFVEGLSQDWEMTDAKSIHLPGLSPGNYRLKVKAVGVDGTESAETELLHFTVRAPFWKRGIFWAAVFAAAAILIYLAGYYRRRQLVDRLRLRQKIGHLEKKALLSQINPHFVFNCLTAIKYLLTHGETEKTEAYIGKFAMLMRDTLDFSENRLITLREETAYIENYLALEELRFGQGFEYETETKAGLDPDACVLPPMLLQPYIENAIRHGLRPKKEGGRLRIRFSAEGECLCVEIDDNGIGRKEAARLKEKNTVQYQSKGMHISSQRALLQGITIHVVDKVTQTGQSSGTLIFLKIPQM